MILETSRGPIDAARLSKAVEETELPVGKLVSTSFFLDGELVKVDQHLQLTEEALVASGISTL